MRGCDPRIAVDVIRDRDRNVPHSFTVTQFHGIEHRLARQRPVRQGSVPAKWPGRPFPRRRLEAAVEVAAALAPRAGGLRWGRRADQPGCGAGSTSWWTRPGSTRTWRAAGRCFRAVDYQLRGLNLGLTEDPALCATVIGWLSLADGS
jgi:hypothetical protein